ncbi:hypothetical protein WMY93_009948 [Mugilogobius chulae]|uniref:Uncharacterized protein n=1 Tax=Mugilogobius chulae TaxID=88201 RepID=A0AAW0PEV5_9GOBI
MCTSLPQTLKDSMHHFQWIQAKPPLNKRHNTTDVEDYYMVAEDNTKTLLSEMSKFTDMQRFLSAELHVAVHPLRVETGDMNKFLDFHFDLDGVVAELTEFSAIKMDLPRKPPKHNGDGHRQPNTGLHSSFSTTCLPVAQWSIAGGFVPTIFLKKTVAATNCPPPPSTRCMLFMNMFGQKQSSKLNLEQTFDLTKVRRVSIHAACDVLSQIGARHLWSKYALLDLVGSRGALTNALSFREAVNYQSNVDGRPMTVNKELLRIARYPLNFLQLYADTPHTRLGQYRPHPVSGEIVCCDLLHQQTKRSMSRAAHAYLKHMEELTLKLKVVSPARIEMVSLLEAPQLPCEISAEAMFDDDKLTLLIASRPMLIPFLENVPEGSFTAAMVKVAEHLVRTLAKQRALARGRGQFTEAWTAFQAEMGLEVLFWGHTLNPRDYRLAVALGVATENENSRTWQRGFLGLAPVNSAVVESEPPPLNNWCQKDVAKARILRLFGFADKLSGSHTTLGLELLQIVIRDLYRDNGAQLTWLSAESPPAGRCTGVIGLDHLVSLLMDARLFGFPATYGTAVSMLKAEKLPLKTIVRAGLCASGLRFFPAFRPTETSLSKLQKWNSKDF